MNEGAVELASKNEDPISLETIGEICERKRKFLVPDYQRGYRWEPTQVSELLEDFSAFFATMNEGDFYCLQPLVVKSAGNEHEVIDGQQRLTTLFILLQALGCADLFEIRYATRPGSGDFLGCLPGKTAGAEEVDRNPDYYHFVQARDVIRTWIDNHLADVPAREAFARNMKDRVQFIRYDARDESSIDIFTRLNIGKIGLTNAELVKAVLLRQSNFRSSGNPSDAEKRMLEKRRQEIASQWDEMEHRLQDDEFWLFFHAPDFDKSTRIDFLFDVLRESEALGQASCDVGRDRFASFRYFRDRFDHFSPASSTTGAKEDVSAVDGIWRKVRDCFAALEEWHGDLLLYHYIGFLLACDKNPPPVRELYSEWRRTSPDGRSIDKRGFLRYVKNLISRKLRLGTVDFETVYDREGGPAKTQCKPLLLFHNVMTVVRQNCLVKNEKKYAMPSFSRFPFHLWKKEKWDVEHIASSTDNPLNEFKDQYEWLKCNLASVRDPRLKNDIRAYLDRSERRADMLVFRDLKAQVENEVDAGSRETEGRVLDSENKNKIWNFVLLDQQTNRSYGNALFPTKRDFVVSRSRGWQLAWNTDIRDWEKKPLPGAFVPECTKKAFLKQYTPSAETKLLDWSEIDAKYYSDDIEETIRFFNEEEIRQ